MLKAQFKAVIRTIWKRKGSNLINIIGITAGLSSILTLGLLIYQFYTTDDIQLNKDRMYYLKTFTAEGLSARQTPFPLLYEIQKVAPEVEAATHIQTWNWPWLKYGEKEVQEQTMYVDTGFFKVFSFKLKEGNAATALTNKFQIVISENIANRLFGKTPAVGQTILSDDSIPLTVAGVLAKIPSNSSIKPEVLLPMDFLKDNPDFVRGADWYNTFAENYLLLRKDANRKNLEMKIERIVKQFYYQDHKKDRVEAVPFSNLISEADNQVRSVITGAIASAAFILLIIIVNLINLNMGMVFSRAKEVAVKQMLGSGKKSIVIQFCLENAFIVFIALIASFIFFINFLLPQLNQTLGTDFREIVFNWRHDYFVLLWILIIAVIIVLIGGIYPALYLTSVKVTETIKGNISSGGDKSLIKNIFIVLQFTLSITLICAAIVLNRQVNYMETASLGFAKDNVVVINLDMAFKDPKSASGKLELILNAVKENPYVKSFSTTSEIPTGIWQNYNDYISVDNNKKIGLRQPGVDAGFANTFEIPVIAGRNFNNDLAAAGEERNIMLNETAVKAFGWADPIGKQLRENGGEDMFTVIGVFKDYHYADLKQPIEPLLHSFRGKQSLVNNRYLSINMDMMHSKEVLADLERRFNAVPSRKPFTYTYLNDRVDKQYSLLTGILNITNYVAVLSIGIACMGLFGLITQTAGRRVKEIAIRKVLGADFLNIASFLTRDYFRLIIIAFVTAIPISYWAMHNWLQDFAYRTAIHWWIFALAGIMATAIALITISYQSVKAALAKPVNSLRKE